MTPMRFVFIFLSVTSIIPLSLFVLMQSSDISMTRKTPAIPVAPSNASVKSEASTAAANPTASNTGEGNDNDNATVNVDVKEVNLKSEKPAQPSSAQPAAPVSAEDNARVDNIDVQEVDLNSEKPSAPVSAEDNSSVDNGNVKEVDLNSEKPSEPSPVEPAAPISAEDNTSINNINVKEDDVNSEKASEPIPDIKANEQKCVLYDRPPRTASTTISGSLGACLESKGYNVLEQGGFNMTRENVLLRLVDLPTLRIASVRKHLNEPSFHFDRMREKCTHLLYITSANTMTARILSFFKYTFIEGHVNGTVEAKDLVRMLATQKPAAYMNREEYFEDYPYVVDKVPEATRLVPDYVIRKDVLVDDLRPLLNALGCAHVGIEATNVHELAYDRKAEEAKKDMDKAVEKIGNALLHGDARYKRMLQIVQTKNRQGLQRARQF